jgi:hypothetical protein
MGDGLYEVPMFPGVPFSLLPSIGLCLCVGRPLVRAAASRLSGGGSFLGSDTNGLLLIGAALIAMLVVWTKWSLGLNHFELLGVSRYDDAGDVVGRYRVLVRDALDAGEEARAVKLRDAFSVVTDTNNRRLAYEQHGPEFLAKGNEALRDVSHLWSFLYVYGSFGAMVPILTSDEAAAGAGGWLCGLVVLLFAGDAAVRFLNWAPAYGFLSTATPHECVVCARAAFPWVALLLVFWKRSGAKDAQEQENAELDMMRRSSAFVRRQVDELRALLLPESAAAKKQGGAAAANKKMGAGGAAREEGESGEDSAPAAEKSQSAKKDD